ncbi:hypothetical protein EYF80_023151 [Liparis tanakae]|uniref:Uncharacterized protein n=1 Tax=Liparis tanakae TaxID=230148 RepID=A0A4Z2HLJ4_9TELE|nr:hypothetical protein EYF80_023151 [Liparis tanakae]
MAVAGVEMVAGQGKFFIIQHAVVVHIRQLPDAPQHRVGQAGAHHPVLGLVAAQLAFIGSEVVEDFIIFGLVFGHHPVLLLITSLSILLREGVTLSERSGPGPNEGSTLHT